MGFNRVPIITPSDCDLGWVVLAMLDPRGPVPRAHKSKTTNFVTFFMTLRDGKMGLNRVPDIAPQCLGTRPGRFGYVGPGAQSPESPKRESDKFCHLSTSA